MAFYKWSRTSLVKPFSKELYVEKFEYENWNLLVMTVKKFIYAHFRNKAAS